MNTRFILVAGGVISGVGKGVTTASLGKILKEYGYKVTLIKIDPYINCDAGTLRPTEHGEVWVTEDGGEIDQDLGTYERFLNEDLPKKNNITTGQIYKAVIDRERSGGYLGQTVQCIPHLIDEIKQRITQTAAGYDIAIVELGGTVGDYENVPYLFAFKALERELARDYVAYILVTYLPIPCHIGEMKTKPTQQAIRELGQEGIFPDFIICRSKQALDEERMKKIETFANIKAQNIIAAPDLTTIYSMPLILEEQGMGKKLLAHFKLEALKEPDWKPWRQLVTTIEKPRSRIQIAIIGKYVNSGDYCIADSYVSIYQALVHAGAQEHIGVDITWFDASNFEHNPTLLTQLHKFHGIIIPGGFGTSGVEGKVAAINYVRKHGIPCLGLCYGMQLMVLEWARNECKMEGANTTEIDPDTRYPIIDILPTQKMLIQKKKYGGTMRLGAYKASLKKESLVHALYNQEVISERHRHRYEVNPAYVDHLQRAGIIFSGHHMRSDGTQLMEFVELPPTVHPFFVATQAHPEFKSRLGSPSPLFHGFIKACHERVDRIDLISETYATVSL